MQAYPVTLYRNSTFTQWGFRLQGGADLHTPIMVQRVFAGSPAEGHLQRGDILVGIDNYDATCLLHREAQDLIGGSGTALSLNVKRTQGSRYLQRGQSVGPAGRQTGFSSYQHQQQQQQQKQKQHQPWQQSQQRHGSTDQYNLYVGRPSAVQQQQQQHQQRQRSESASQYEGSSPWQQGNHYQQQRAEPAQQSVGNFRYQPSEANLYAADNQIQRQAPVKAGAAGQPLAQQRSTDDNEVDYSFTKQSVAERMRAFMQQQQKQQPQQPPAIYHSVPRSGYSASRFGQPRPVSNIEAGGGHNPFADLGWSPPADKMRNARRNPGQPASRAAFEQTSYLPSQGIGAQPESPPIALRSRHRQQQPNFGAGGGGGGQQRHSVSGGGFAPQTRARNWTTAAADNNNNSSSSSKSPLAAYNSRQYNTPINLYSRQNAANAFEGQTGMTAGRQTGQQSASRHVNSGQAAPVPINQSQVYKLVHEEEDRKPTRGHGGGGQWTSGSSRKWESDPDEPGVSEF